MMSLEEMTLYCEYMYDREENENAKKSYGKFLEWLKKLKEYTERDTPAEAVTGDQRWEKLCPRCKGLVVVGVQKYCDNCGQRLKPLLQTKP